MAQASLLPRWCDYLVVSQDLGDIDGYDEYEEDEYEFVSDDEFEEFVGTVSNLPETTGTKPDGEEKP